jgi:hypothetical protein
MVSKSLYQKEGSGYPANEVALDVGVRHMFRVSGLHITYKSNVLFMRILWGILQDVGIAESREAEYS